MSNKTTSDSGMSGYAWLMVGNMISRVFGDYVQGMIEKVPVLGPFLADSRRTIQSEKRENEIASKVYINEHEHELKLKEMRQKFENDLEIVQLQFFNKQEDAKYKEFLKSCFPLRNPYDIAMPFNYLYGAKEDQSRIRMSTVAKGNGLPVVPLRLILAMPDSLSSLASDINSELSLFLINNFPSNGMHAVLSDIGSWREDIPVNDASINYLYKGLHGQPTVVVVPEFMDRGGTIKFKIWSWAMGDERLYPEGFNFGQIDVDVLSRHLWCEEIKEYAMTLQRAGMKNKAVSEAMIIIKTIEDPSYNLSMEDKQRLLSQIDIPDEVKKFNNHSKKLRTALSTIFSVVCAMYTDAYHLKTSGVTPLLPYILHTLPGANLYLREILGHYLLLTHLAHREHIFSTEMAADFELTLIENIRKIGGSENEYIAPLINDYKTYFLPTLLDAAKHGDQSQESIKKLNAKANNLKI